MPTAKTLTDKNIARVFDVTLMTVYNWKSGRTASKSEFPTSPTPARVRRWAERRGVPMVVAPESVLGADVLKPGPKARPAAPAKSKQRAAARAGA